MRIDDHFPTPPVKFAMYPETSQNLNRSPPTDPPWPDPKDPNRGMVQINPGTGNEREIRLHGQRPVAPEMPKLNFKRLMVETLSCDGGGFYGDFIGDLVGVQWFHWDLVGVQWFHGDLVGFNEMSWACCGLVLYSLSWSLQIGSRLLVIVSFSFLVFTLKL